MCTTNTHLSIMIKRSSEWRGKVSFRYNQKPLDYGNGTPRLISKMIHCGFSFRTVFLVIDNDRLQLYNKNLFRQSEQRYMAEFARRMATQNESRMIKIDATLNSIAKRRTLNQFFFSYTHTRNWSLGNTCTIHMRPQG